MTSMKMYPGHLQWCFHRRGSTSILDDVEVTPSTLVLNLVSSALSTLNLYNFSTPVLHDPWNSPSAHIAPPSYDPVHI
ncbi:hypothetical protein D9758_012388 [Tetrapyrgos nigripes]|uniref:Uncharacterized protein n=1 Tax=Tetrapyrgos nigripes TaxID=182062 RepID=A0A8H5FZ15_9AGAR|nr:hypothetical protein D9758_012388 [Tetrapyrgos nigripes]